MRVDPESKLEPRDIPARFLYRDGETIYVLTDAAHGGKVVGSRNVRFIEKLPIHGEGGSVTRGSITMSESDVFES